MVRITLIAFLTFLASFPAFLSAAETQPERENLEVFADHLKFQNGLEFMKLRMTEKALETFNEYLEIYQQGVHRHEAHKLIADIYFSNIEYLKALRHYRTLYEEYSTSESGIEGYFNTGVCYDKMGYEEKAVEVFNDIIAHHPDSIFARHAQLQLDLLTILME
ncbi:MAG: tetratricopeptide repeat protein [Spirochaetes bacterium]|nr:tetratricopeptide repeat protein [Spirochaetota bacterium]